MGFEMEVEGAVYHREKQGSSTADALDAALQNLLQGISAAVASHSSDNNEEDQQAACTKLIRLAAATHSALTLHGRTVELSTPNNEHRDRFRNVGRSIWMTIRSHPVVFSDAKQLHNKDKASAGGFIRAIAARLILMDGIRTHNLMIPSVIDSCSSEIVDVDEEGDEDDAHKQTTSARRYACSTDELEFGLKCFSRSGRALLQNANDSDLDSCLAAYSTLELANQCWKALVKSCGDDSDEEELQQRLNQNLEEAFDAAALLPDAASLVNASTPPSNQHGEANNNDPKAHGAESSSISTNERVTLKQLKMIGTPDHIVTLLQNLDELVSSHSMDQRNNTNQVAMIQRFIPTLARAAYKHGNRFARLSSHLCSRACLRVSLAATDVGLAAIRSHCEKSDDDNALRVQEQELLVVSKECFYVLAHVCEALGKHIEGHKCLDRIEVYVDEQKARDESLYNQAMEKVSASGSVTDVGLLADPRALDKQDIQTRAQTARARAKMTEYRERANLSFSRIMLYQHQLPAHYQAEATRINVNVDSNDRNEIEERIDIQIQRLIELSTKFLGSNTNTATQEHNGGANRNNNNNCGLNINACNNSVMDLTLTACRLVRVRRLMACTIDVPTGCGGDISQCNPYDAMLERYGPQHQQHLMVVLDHLNAVLSACHEVRRRIFVDNDDADDNDAMNEDEGRNPGADNVNNSNEGNAGVGAGAGADADGVGSYSVGIRSLDMIGVEVAESVLSSLQANLLVCSPLSNKQQHINQQEAAPEHDNDNNGIDKSMMRLNSTNAIAIANAAANDVSLLPSNYANVHNNALPILEQARTQLARAVALYRTLPCTHGITAQYAEMLVNILDLHKNSSNVLSATTDVANHNGIDSSCNMDNEEAAAEATAIRAYALTQSGSLVGGLNAARAAWKRHISIHNFVVLFHCAVLSDSDASNHHQKRMMSSNSALVELDEAMRQLQAQGSVATGNFKTEANDAILRVCPTLAQSALGSGNKIMLLGVQQRWVSLLVDRLIVLLKDDGNDRSAAAIWNQDIEDAEEICLFSLLRAYLVQYEEVILANSGNNGKLLHVSRGHSFQVLDRTLASVQALMKRLRDFRWDNNCNLTANKGDGNMRNGDNENKGDLLIWEQNSVQRRVGTHADCVWLAEQTWNIAVQMSNSGLKSAASSLFRKAHDFALLSEEECGQRLTRGYLDGDENKYNTDVDFGTLFTSDETLTARASELSSEFSAHCLLLSVANAVDAIYSSKNVSTNSDCDDPNTEKACADESLPACICQCRSEFVATAGKDEQKREANEKMDRVIAWLALRTMVELGNDALISNGLEGTLSKVVVAEPDDASHLYLCAKRAQVNKMWDSCKILLRALSNHLVKNSMSTVNVSTGGKDKGDTYTITLGDIQKKLVQLASSVNETVQAFENIAVSDKKKSISIYNQDSINWFTIEAYNRGINLMFMGDILNAERLLAIALNLLPNCGKEVECHAGEMRLAYHRAVEKKNALRGFVTNAAAFGGDAQGFASDDAISLFHFMPSA
mmetsp:Transcript_14255/g.21073  ORF Transcript_14255/g.21073 Transcript_14255/m.21073 type:complete len:1526 (-) Transcript_14255:365-4942(-)